MAFMMTGAMSAKDNLFRGAKVSVSTSPQTAALLTDGDHSRKSTWISGMESGSRHVVEVGLDCYCSLDSIVIYTGIPAGQMTAEEKHQAAGYWCMKNFILQYWDDANWTDIAETYTTENRLDRVAFRFKSPVKSYCFRLVSSDGEPIRISEIEGYGSKDLSMRAPELLSEDRPDTREDRPSTISATILPDHAGRTMQYVGYNQGYFVPGSNVSAWWEYSGVNSARIWADLNTYVKASWFEDEPAVGSLDEFEARKAEIRSGSPASVRLDDIRSRADQVINSTNINLFTITPGINYYVPIVEYKFYYTPGLDLSVGFGGTNYKTATSKEKLLSNTTFGISLALLSFEYRPLKHFGISFRAGDFTYGLNSMKSPQSDDGNGTTAKYNTNNVSFGLNLNATIGFRCYF